MKPIKRSRTIYLLANAGTAKGAQLQFPLDRYLADKRVTGFEVVSDNILTTAPDSSPMATTLDLLVTTMTLVRQSDEVHQEFPLVLANSVIMNGIWKEIEPTVIDWQRSYLTLNGAPATAVQFTYGILVHYEP